MRHLVDAAILLALFALLALLMHAQTSPGVARSMPTDHTFRRAPMGELDRPGTRFDLLFREPDLVR